MYLSNRDIKWAIDQGILVVTPPPQSFDETSIDLHLDSIEKGARVWDTQKYLDEIRPQGIKTPDLSLGAFEYQKFAAKYLIEIPEKSEGEPKVSKRGHQVIVRPGGFVLWTTKEWVGTPEGNPQFISFVNAKSTKARTGLVVHLSAPTIHAGWEGNITLEIVNFGPFNFILEEGDAIAQLTVAKITSTPDLALKEKSSQTIHQTDPSGAGNKPTEEPKTKRGRKQKA